MDENRITYFAETDARNKRVKFGIKAKDRTRHVYVIGKTGMGKSTLLENMAIQDIQNGEGMCFIDPHGKTADLLLEYVPKNRIRDVIHIAPFDVEHPISFNVLESVDPEKRHLVVSGLMSTFKKIWEDAWSARMEYILTNTLLALLEYPGSTLLGVNRMLSDKDYRKEVVSHIQDPSVKAFWTKEFANYTERMAAEAVPAIQNKVGQFTANPLIRNMIGQPNSSFDFRQAMDTRKIIVINLSKGRIGDENMKLLGGLLVTKIYLAAMSRADVPDRVVKILPNFYLFVDEFQNFANASFADILSEARKYKLNLTIAHQYIEQMDEQVSAAVFGNVGTMIAFRVGAADAEVLEKEFSPAFVIEDLVNLGFTQIYLKLMIDGLTSPPFSAVTLPPIAEPEFAYVTEIIEASREQFAKNRAAVEAEIVKFHEPTPKAPVVKAAAPTIKVVPALTVLKPVEGVNKVSNSVAEPIKAVESKKNPASYSPREASVSSSSPVLSSPRKRGSAGSITFDSSRARIPASAGMTMPTVSSYNTTSPKPIQNSLANHPNVNQAKPVSLSSLNPNRPKTDGKAQTPEHVNELKNALAAVLAKNKSKESGTKNQGNTKNQIPSIKQIPNPNSQRPNQQPMTNNQPSYASYGASEGKQPVPEVPEEVLKGVLKV